MTEQLPPWDDSENGKLAALLAQRLPDGDAFTVTLTIRPGTYTVHRTGEGTENS